MKKKVLIISLLVLSGALIGSDTPKPHYQFSGEEAVDYLIRNGHCRDCDLSNQDLRATIATLNSKYRKRGFLIDFSGANLTNANLSGTDLSYATMQDTNLSGANLSGANITSASTNNVNMAGANLSGANLSGASMKNAIMTDTDLTNANLTAAHLYNADMTGAKLSGANLTGAYYLDTVTGYNG